MSTRAIIGIQNKDGTITGGWQWNDGKGLLPLLRNHFNTEEKIKKLIMNGVWNNIVSPKDEGTLTHFKKWTKREGTAYYLVPIEKCYLLKEKPCDNAEFCFGGDIGVTINIDGSMTFSNFEIAKGQDINYLYLFHPNKKEWEVYQ